MSVQIAIRLPDEIVEQLDDHVRQGVASNRTELIRTLLVRELHRVAADAELAILTQPFDDPDDLAGLAAWASHQGVNSPTVTD